MMALQRALALEEMHRVSLAITENLYLDVPRARDGFLHVDAGVAKGGGTNPSGRLDGGIEFLIVIDNLHALATAAERGLDDYRIPQSLRCLAQSGDIHVLDSAHFSSMKDGAIVANSGHFNVEINIPALEKMAESKRPLRPYIDEYTLPDGRRIILLGEGRLINLAAAEGHPASVMDMSFANQALCVEYMVKGRKSEPGGMI